MSVKDVVFWTGLISGYVKAGFFQMVLYLFSPMLPLEPNAATLVTLLVACRWLVKLRIGTRIHGLMVMCGFSVGLIGGNTLLDMYLKCGRVDEVHGVFQELLGDIVSWTSMISCLAQCEHAREAIELLHDMLASGIEPDKVVMSTALSAGESLGALDSGRWVHEYILHRGTEWDVHIGIALVDMYAKCWCLDEAVATFRKMPHRNGFSWNALIGGLTMHGRGNDAIRYFTWMVKAGIAPNEVTFIAALSACSHSGMVVEVRHFFNSMTKVYHLTPRIEHHGCMIDLLGRAGLVA